MHKEMLPNRFRLTQHVEISLIFTLGDKPKKKVAVSHKKNGH